MRILSFEVLRPFLLVKGLVTNRNRPDFKLLDSFGDPDRFVWEILPHAARTFAPCIALLPARSASAAAVAYLYCRMLDTYEDLLPVPAGREAAIADFAERLADGESGALRPPRTIENAADRDDRDRAHLLLLRKSHLVDQVYLGLDAQVRALVRDLIEDMAGGMIRYSKAFDLQGGVLVGEEQVAGYCRAVIGNPVVFTLRLLALSRTGSPDLPPEQVEHAMRVSELVQLANITRDIEKDLARGVAYWPNLREDVETPGRPGTKERIRLARQRLLAMALARAPSYRRMVTGMQLPRVSFTRASALLMLLYTWQYFGRCAARCGLGSWSRGPGGVALLVTAGAAMWWPRFASRALERAERDFERAYERIRRLFPAASAAPRSAAD